MGRAKYSIEKVREIAEENNCKVITKEYKNTKTKMDFECACGRCFTTTLEKFLHRGQTVCLVCSKQITKDKLKLDYSTVKKRIEGMGCKLISKTYEKASSPLTVECSCGNEFVRSYHSIYTGGVNTCSDCQSEAASENQRHSIEHVKSVIEQEGCKWVSGEYKNNESLLILECPCGNEFETVFLRFTSKSKPKKQCNDCGEEIKYNKLRHSYDYVKECIEKEGCKLISKEYKNTKTNLRIECACGNEFETTFTNFTGEKEVTRCDACSWGQSKGEKKIQDFLVGKNIAFTPQQSIEGCMNDKHLRFDFIIYDENEKITMAIEFDGEQHFRPIEWFGGAEVFKKQQQNDKIKDSFCKENDIPLLRIPYYEYENIDVILENKLMIILCQA